MSSVTSSSIKLSEFDNLLKNNKSILHALLFAISEEISSKDITTPKFPSKLKQYRNIMQPIRITMLKLLYQEFQMTSVEMKQSLGLSWVEYSNHIRPLEELGLVKTQNEFIDGDVRQVVYLEELGRESYLDLRELLVELLDDTTLDFQEEDTKSKLYPSS